MSSASVSHRGGGHGGGRGGGGGRKWRGRGGRGRGRGHGGGDRGRGWRRGGGAKRSRKDNRWDADRTYQTVLAKNDLFEKYYKAQHIVAETEWDEFMFAFTRPLPTTFRLSVITGIHGALMSELQGNCFGLKEKPIQIEERAVKRPEQEKKNEHEDSDEKPAKMPRIDESAAESNGRSDAHSEHTKVKEETTQDSGDMDNDDDGEKEGADDANENKNENDSKMSEESVSNVLSESSAGSSSSSSAAVAASSSSSSSSTDTDSGQFDFRKITVPPPSQLPWYPNGLGWYFGVGRSDLRKYDDLYKFRQFLIAETEQGNVTRQEAVSMLPPLLLDVEPHHNVLDMCAAPGSKTAQLLEGLFRRAALQAEQSGDMSQMNKYVPSGMVIANDSDSKRAYMLVHQIKRLGTPNFLVTTHDGQFFPTLFKSAPTAENPSAVEPIYFDRILSDVPCSGDATIRKNITIWKRWSPTGAFALHTLQMLIAKRSFQLLRVGGLMVYSTCSLNPIEDEAVVAELLRRSRGCLELVDVNDRLPGLIRSAGLSTWQVMDETGKFHEHFDANIHVKPSKIRKSFFPPTDEEAKTMHLERSFRVLPHKQDTGGFFIALLRKTAHPTPERPLLSSNANGAPAISSSSSSDSVSHSIAQLTTSVAMDTATSAPVNSCVTESSSSSSSFSCTSESSALLASACESVSIAAIASLPSVSDAPTGGLSADELFEAKEAAEAAKSAEVNDDEEGGSHGGGGSQSGDSDSKNDDPFQPFPQDSFKEIVSFFGMPADTASEHYWTRGIKRGYFVSSAIASVLSCPRNDRLKVVHGGSRAFEKNPSRGKTEVQCNWRIAQEGIDTIYPWLGKQVLRAPLDHFLQLLKNTQVFFDQFPPNATFEAQVKSCEYGCVVVALADEFAKNYSNRAFALTAWMSARSISLMVGKTEKHALINLLSSNKHGKQTSAKAEPQLCTNNQVKKQEIAEENKQNADEQTQKHTKEEMENTAIDNVKMEIEHTS